MDITRECAFFSFSKSELYELLTLIAEKIDETTYCSLRLVNDSVISTLHKEAFGTFCPTNILSFPSAENSELEAETADSHELINNIVLENDTEYEPNLEFESNIEFDTDFNYEEYQDPTENLDLNKEFILDEEYNLDKDLNLSGDDKTFIGELVLSIDTFERECVLYNQEKKEYIVRLLSHGYLHLLGYEHGESMYALTEEIVETVGSNISREK